MTDTRSNPHRFPMFFDVSNWHAVVIGGGPVALRKTRRLLDANAKVLVVAPSVCADLQTLADNGELAVNKSIYKSSDLNGARIVIAATANIELNRAIALDAKAIGASVNVANDPMAGDFIMPSLIDRTPMLIALSSGGASPVLSRLLTARIDAFVPANFANLSALAGKYRSKIKQTLSGWRVRRRFWEQQLGGHVGELAMQGRMEEAEQALTRAIDNVQHHEQDGEVYLVGAGPGDPDLLSFRALRFMQHADVVFYDRLVSDAIMSLVKPDAEKIYVGKQRQNHAMPQNDINAQLVNHAKQGKRVLRLKGGDPFIFGRGGEEIETLAENGIAFQVVPGITAAAGCASYAGIPLTHRDHAQSCIFVTGHLKNNTIDLNWAQLAQPQQTVVIYMGLVGLRHIVANLVKHGMAETMPIALISQGTTQQQQVVIGTLANIVERVNQSSVKAPTLTIIGSVVSLHERLNWFNPETG